MTTFDSSDVTNVTKIERSLNSIPIYHLSSRFGIEEYAMLRRTAPSIVPYEMWMSHGTPILNVSPWLISRADPTFDYGSTLRKVITFLILLESLSRFLFPLLT